MALACLPTACYTFALPASCCQGIPVSALDVPDRWPGMEKDSPYSCQGQHQGMSHAYSSLRLPLILQAAPVSGPSSSGVSAVPSIYLGQELSPKGDFAVSCKKGTFLLQPGKSSAESDHRRQGFNSTGGHEF